ncbi:surface anchored protein [Streptococcus pneumoniae]|uniref:Surface anchored protein n=2 Tax=Streptococcus pneumoniae TaxID=1313 RepID=A0A0U0PRI1_STREE|nr:surface anchored protein [Streptococcus pneumoniae]CGF80574.1 surface anchored protein [Streptococcus pneumoniae]CIP60463.1 surface anchored protein [Streptococcus pneumoniae]CIT42809.1 surface anchored protein [Streptococcus pneumoniae]CIW97394.1 surface anchored protein [Streptococcus pneumoniae]
MPVTTIQPRSPHPVTSRAVQVDTTAPKVSLGQTILPTSESAATTPLYRILQGQSFAPKLKVWDDSGTIQRLDIIGAPNGVTKHGFGTDFQEQTTAREDTPYSGSTLTGAVTDNKSLGIHIARITVSDKTGNATTYYLKYEVYPPTVEAKQGRFGQVKDKNLIDGDAPSNYIKFKNANGQEVQKPSRVDVAWVEKPRTDEPGLSKTGRIKITYHLTSEIGAEVRQEKFVTINTPVYYATLTQNRYTATYGGEFINRRNPTDARRYINYNGGPHFSLRELRAYWENSSGASGQRFASSIRGWSTNYLGKKIEKLMVRYPSNDGKFRGDDDYSERYEILTGTFVVKPVKPSIQTSIGKVGQDRVTVNNVNSGTTVVVYDMANPNSPLEIGRVTVPKEGNHTIKDNVQLTLASGQTFRKNQKIATRVIYEIDNQNERVASDFSETLTVDVDKSGVSAKQQELEQALGQQVSTDGKTEDSKRAYEQAKEKVRQAIEKAKQVQQDGGATEAKVTEAENALTQAKAELETAKNGLTDVDKSGVSAKQQELEQALGQQVSTDGKTEDSKRAYEQAKEKVRQAIEKAKQVQQDGGATEAKVTEAENALTQAKAELETAKNGLTDVDKSGSQTPASPSDPAQSGTSPVTPPSATRNRRTPPRRSRRSVGFVGNSQTGTTPSAVDKSELQTLVEDLERRLQGLAGLSPEVLEEAQRILREAQAALANDSLTAQELAELLAKVRQALNSIQAGTSADKSPSASNSNKEAESAKEPTNATDLPLYGVFGAAVLSLLGALLFAVARKKNSQLDNLSRELDQLLVELKASDKDKKGLGKAKKLAKKARTFVDSQQKDPQKEAELISEIKTILSQLREEV